MAPYIDYAEVIKAAGPVGYWRLGEDQNALVAADASGNGNHGSYAGASERAPGLIADDPDGAYVRWVSTAFVEITEAGALIGAGPYSLEVWLQKLPGASNGTNEYQVALGATSGAGTTYAHTIRTTSADGVSAWHRRADGSLASSPSLLAGTSSGPAHVVLTWDGATTRVYVNGEERYATAAVDSYMTANPTNRLRIGTAAHSTQANLGTIIDEVAAYDRALSADEVKLHYDVGVVEPKSSEDAYGASDYQRNTGLLVKLVRRDGSLIHELPSARVDSITWELNAPGNARISMPTLDKRLRDLELGLHEVQIWRNDQLWWWGIPVRLSGDHIKVNIELEGLLAYFEWRYLTYTSLEYTSIDQLNIGWNLLSHAQSAPNSSWNITAADYELSGRVRSRRYKRDEHENILDALKEFNELDDGFDFDIVVDSTGQRLWTPYYPRKGVFRSSMVLEWGRNIIGFRHNEDALSLANHVYATGGSNGEIKFEQNHRDEDSIAYRGQFQAIVSEGSQMDINWLKDRAVQEVEDRKDPEVLPSITVVNDPVDVVSVLRTGDVVPISIHHGRVNVDGNFRVTAITWNPGDKLQLTTVEEAA